MDAIDASISPKLSRTTHRHLPSHQPNSTDGLRGTLPCNAKAWLLKFTANDRPPQTIYPNTYYTGTLQYRLFNDWQPNFNSIVTVGSTPDPCLRMAGDPGVLDIPTKNNVTGQSRLGFQYQLAQGRVGTDGQTGWKLSNGREVPYIWSVIEADYYGNPVRTDQAANYQNFPTYWIYINGRFSKEVKQKTVEQFASATTKLELLPGDIQ